VHLSRKIDDTREIQSDIFAFTVLEARRQISDKNKTGLNILKLGNKTKEKTITTLYVEQVTYYLPAWPRAKNELRLASLWRTTRDEGGALWRDKDGRKKKQQHRLSGVTSEQHQERLKTKGVREGVKVASIKSVWRRKEFAKVWKLQQSGRDASLGRGGVEPPRGGRQDFLR